MAERVEVMLSEEEVDRRIQEIGEQISKDYAGKQVHLVEMRTELAPDANVRHRPLLLKEIEKYVTVHTGCRGLEVRPDGVLCETEDNQQIRKEDKRRADNYRYYTGRIWGMSVSFDLALNTELGMEYIEECIQKAL